ncbi:MAG: ABC transporter permease [Microbacterium sp.]|uniref:ABC transporter permease n=1 Tax=Microbacterium sp. TaxID=51671 RepID=UPI0039E57012
MRRRVYARREPSRRLRTLLGGVGIVAVLLIWQLCSSTGLIKPIILPSPIAIVQASGRLAASGTLWTASWESAQLYGIGFGIALVSGLLLGLILGWYRRAEAVLDPLLSLLYATPHLALLPLITVWFGIGIGAQIALVILICIFPIIINTAAGVSAIDREHIRLARSLLATNVDVLRTIALPGAIPAVVAGIRQGLVLGLMGVVVAEYFYGNKGLGGLIFTSSLTLNTADAFVGVFMFAFAALLLTALLRLLQKRIDRWRA